MAGKSEMQRRCAKEKRTRRTSEEMRFLLWRIGEVRVVAMQYLSGHQNLRVMRPVSKQTTPMPRWTHIHGNVSDSWAVISEPHEVWPCAGQKSWNKWENIYATSVGSLSTCCHGFDATIVATSIYAWDVGRLRITNTASSLSQHTRSQIWRIDTV